MDSQQVSLILGGVGFLFGSGTIGTILILAYRVGGWREETTQLRRDLNGPFHDKVDSAIEQFEKKSDSTARHTKEAIDLALKAQAVMTAQLPTCREHAVTLETQQRDLDRLAESVQKVMDRQQRKSVKE